MRVVIGTFWNELSFWLVKSKPQKLFAILISSPPPRPPSHALLFPSLRPSSTQERPWRPFWSMWRPLNPRWSRSQGEPARSPVCVSPSGGGNAKPVTNARGRYHLSEVTVSCCTSHTSLEGEKKGQFLDLVVLRIGMLLISVSCVSVCWWRGSWTWQKVSQTVSGFNDFYYNQMRVSASWTVFALFCLSCPLLIPQFLPRTVPMQCIPSFNVLHTVWEKVGDI